ncbi:DIP1984 family protein [Suttonella ornithocola]|uniref:Septicolysin n=1 Tax=Suttonella ornithocola TaxID=279832 RepID=A0A380MU47_9GAMM|nr:DIP1984 family protein [Suttonella ornithocola]SUO95704.1 Uncharacterised protein [Suttonella ornithocola]
MKLAEALSERADLQRRLFQLQDRLTRNAQYQEGETPAEEPHALLEEYERTSAALETLVIRINRSNHHLQLENGLPMIDALAKRERLQAKHNMLIQLANAAMPEQTRYSRSEIKMLAAVSVKAIRQQADEVAKTCRLLDLQIQAANWQHELIE